MYIDSGSNGSLTNLTITNNNASAYSTGGIYDNSNIHGNMVTASGLVITGNIGANAGGLYIDFYSDSIFALTSYTLKNNLCPSFPSYDEVHCFVFPSPGTNSICACSSSGLDPAKLCLDCFSDVYGSSCNSQCSPCPTNQTCTSGKLGANGCVCDNSIIGNNCTATSSHHNTTSSHNNTTSSHHNTTSSHKTSSHKSTASGLFLTHFYIIAFVVLIVQRLLN